MGQRGELFTTKSYTQDGKKTFFFNVKENRYRDLFLNIVETQKKKTGGYNRHSIMIYQEDLKNFLSSFGDAINQLREKNKAGSQIEINTESGKRKYVMTIKIAKDGIPFLIITESRKSHSIGFQNESVRIYQDQLQDYQLGFDKAIQFILNHSTKGEK